MTIKEKLKQIGENKKEIDRIEKEIAEFEDSIKNKKDAIQVLEIKNKQACAMTQVEVNFTDFIEELAKQFQCEKNKIRYKIEVPEITLYRPLCERKTLLEMFNAKHFYVHFYNLSGRKSMTVAQRGFMGYRQTDGKSFGEHIKIKEDGKDFNGIKVEEGRTLYTYEIDDLNQIVFSESLERLVYVDRDGSIHPRGNSASIMMRCAILKEKEEKQQEKQ